MRPMLRQRMTQYLIKPLSLFTFHSLALLTELLFTVAMLGVLLTLSALSMSWSREALLNGVLTQLPVFTPFQLEFAEIHSPSLNDWSLGYLQLSYQQQPLVELEDLQLTLNWQALMSHQVIVEHLSAQSLFVNLTPTDWPTPAAPPATAVEEPPAPLPAFLQEVQFRLGRLSLPRIRLQHPIIPEGRALSLEAQEGHYGPLNSPSMALQSAKISMDQGRHHISASLTPQRLDAQINLDHFPLQLLETLIPDLNTGWLSANIHASGPLSLLAAAGSIEVDSAFQQRPAKAKATFGFASQQLHIPELQAQWGELSARAQGRVDLNQQTLDVLVSSASAPLSMLKQWDIPLPEALTLALQANEVRINGPWTAPTYAGQVSGKGQFKTLPFSVQVVGKGDLTHFAIAQAQIQAQATRADLSGSLFYDGHFDAQMSFANLNLAYLALADVPLPAGLSTMIDGQVSAKGPFTAPEFNATLSARSQYQGVSAFTRLQADGDLNEIRLQSLQSELKDSVTLATPARLAAQGKINLRSQSLDLEVSSHQLPLTLIRLAGQTLPDSLSGLLDAKAQINGLWRQPALKLDATLAGQLLEQPYRLAAKGSYQQTTATLRQLQFTLGEITRLEAQGHYSPDAVTLHTDIQNLDLNKLNSLGVTVQGNLTGQLDLEHNRTGLQASGTVNYHTRVLHADPKQSSPLELNARLTTEPSGLKLVSHLSSDTGTDTPPISELIVRLPLAPYHSWLNDVLSGKRPPTAPLSADIAGSLRLDPLQFLLDRDLHQFGGKLDLAVHSEGFYPHPIISGTLGLTEGHYRNLLYGTELTRILADIGLSEKAITIKQFQASTPDNGQITLTGAALTGSPMQVDLGLKASRANLLHRADMQGTVSGDLRLTGTQTDLLLAGDLNIRPITLQVSTGMADRIPEIEVTTHKTRRPVQENPLPLQLDVNVWVDQQAFIRGNIMNAELKGNVSLKGAAQQPAIAGKFETIRGYVDLFGKRFALTQGYVSFLGSSALLQATGEYITKDETIKAEVSGTPDDLKIVLSSVPDLPQDEILARLLFGKSVRSMTPMQAVRLANAIQSMQGGKSRIPDPVEYTRQLMEVDQLTVESAESEKGNGVKVGIGKYVTERVYLEVERSPDPTQPWQGKVDIELTPNVNLQTTTGRQSGFGGVELLWKKDY
ncbi:MAG: translocation/assembly module TamB [Hahellaceae bacterium]|nr:translocation/assembly module TamB [Hahellaceae bacterium]MCP5169225.1 translocation/assembly module TamB [Hahellaceae bacterium]